MSETVRRTSVPQFSYCCPRTIRIRLSHIRFLSRNLALDGLDVFHVYIFHIIYIDTFIKCILRVYIYIYYIVYGGFHKWDSPKMDGFFLVPALQVADLEQGQLWIPGDRCDGDGVHHRYCGD